MEKTVLTKEEITQLSSLQEQQKRFCYSIRSNRISNQHIRKTKNIYKTTDRTI